MGREQFGVGVAIVDLDSFKKVNDSLGHLVGDRILVETATRMRQVLRPYDCLGRYGGDEFLIVMPTVTDDELLSIADRVRTAVGTSPIQVPGHAITQTVSIGASIASGDSPQRWESVVLAADKALYSAKKHGRNRAELISCASDGVCDAAA
jgi:diguanylate cyclase (GGDEF)-like protein